MVSQYPSFFSKYLSRPLGLVYGQDRPSKKELGKREKEGTISAKDLHDEKLSGPLVPVSIHETGVYRWSLGR